MFSYQINSMRNTIDRQLTGRHPPQRVGILREHAEFLGVSFEYAERVNEVRPSGLVAGVPYGSVVMVRLQDLFLALKTAVGIDDRKSEEPSGSVGETQTENADND